MRCEMERFPCLKWLSWENEIVDVLDSFREPRCISEWEEAFARYEWLGAWHLVGSHTEYRIDENGHQQKRCLYALVPDVPLVLGEMVIHNAQLMAAVRRIDRIERNGRPICLTRALLEEPWYRSVLLFIKHDLCERYKGYYRLTRAFREYLKRHGVSFEDSTH